MRVSKADLRWWLDLAPTLTWTFAKTYAKSAPHWYVTVLGNKTPGLTLDDCLRAGRVIRTFGEPGKFYSYTNLYLYADSIQLGPRSLKFWAMWGDDPQETDADLINLATADRTYGPQRDFDTRRLDALRLPPADE